MSATHATTTMAATADVTSALSGRKGISYDWRAALAEVEGRTLDTELAALVGAGRAAVLSH